MSAGASPESFRWANATASAAHRVVKFADAPAATDVHNGWVDYQATDTGNVVGVTLQDGVAQKGHIAVHTQPGMTVDIEVSEAVDVSSGPVELAATTDGKCKNAASGDKIAAIAYTGASAGSKLVKALFVGVKTTDAAKS